MSMRKTWRRLARITRRDAREETDEEIRFHFDMRVRDYMARGLNEEEARAAARERFGDKDPIREECLEIERRERRSRIRRGWAADSMEPGDTITAILRPLKDGSYGGVLGTIILADGTALCDPFGGGASTDARCADAE